MNNLSKEDALRRLDKIDAEQKELRKIIESSTIKGLITERVRSVRDACVELGKNYDEFMEECAKNPEEAGTKKVKLFIKALRESWKPDYKNKSQGKYYPYFKYENDGFVFYVVADDFYFSCVGSSLVLPTPELVKHAIACILAEYNEHLKN